MLYTSVKVTIKNDTATINNQILLYRGDKNVEVQFEILESLYRQYKLEGPNTIENLSASYGQLIIKKPDSTFVPSAVVETKDGKVIFTIPAEMIDEESEVGEFSFQIILFDESRSSKVSLPPVVNGIVVKAPLTTDNNTNAVGTAEVGDAHVAVSYGVEDTFDVDGDYNRTNWVSGDLITSSNLNKIEDAIFTINDNLKNAEFPTQDGVATELYVDTAISALRTELIALINAGGGDIPVVKELIELEPQVGKYAREDGVLRDDARALYVENVPLSDYTEFYVTAKGKWSCTLMTLFDSDGEFVWGTDSAYNGGPTAWTEEHIVVSELLADHPTACYVTFSAIDSDAANTVLTVLARPK